MNKLAFSLPTNVYGIFGCRYELEQAARLVSAGDEVVWKLFVNEKETEDDGGPVEILFDGIVGDWWDELDSKSIASFLQRNRGREVIMRINSPGGFLLDGIGIYNALVAHDAKTTARIEGTAMSAASLIAMGADVIEMRANTTMMIHKVLAGIYGHAYEIEDILRWVNTFDDTVRQTYMARTGASEKAVEGWLEGAGHDGTIFSAQEAIDVGLADVVLPLKSGSSSASNRKATSVSNDTLRQQQLRMATAHLQSRSRRES